MRILTPSPRTTAKRDGHPTVESRSCCTPRTSKKLPVKLRQVQPPRNSHPSYGGAHLRWAPPISIRPLIEIPVTSIRAFPPLPPSVMMHHVIDLRGHLVGTGPSIDRERGVPYPPARLTLSNRRSSCVG